MVGIAVLACFAAIFLIDKNEVPRETPYPAQDFAFPDLQGRLVRLSDYRGKVVLVDFWATYCLPCLEELPHLKALYRRHKDQCFTLLGVSLDFAGKEDVAAYARQYDVPYPILLSNAEPPEGYRIRGIPTAFLIDQQGRVVKEYLGYKEPDQIEADVLGLLGVDKETEQTETRGGTNSQIPNKTAQPTATKQAPAKR